MIIAHDKSSFRFVLFCLGLLFLLQCSTGPAFEDLSGSNETPNPSASGTATLAHFSFGGWRGTSTSEHFVLTGLDSNSMMAPDIAGDAFILAPEGGFSAYLH